MYSRFSNLKLSYKLTVVVILTIVLSIALYGTYFDHYLKKSFYENTKKRMQYATEKIYFDLIELQGELYKNINYLQEDESFLASINFINSYGDKNNYNTSLIDEEKKVLLNHLLNTAKLSVLDAIILYDKDMQLLAYIQRELDGTYTLHAISYDADAKPLRLFASETNNKYESLPYQEDSNIPFQHNQFYSTSQDAVLLFDTQQGDLRLTLHHDIYDEALGKKIAHVEIMHRLNALYFEELSRDLDMKIALSADKSFQNYSLGVFGSSTLRDIKLNEEDEAYVAALAIHTSAQQDSDSLRYITFTLDKYNLDLSLRENRFELILFLLLLLLIIPGVLVSVFKRWLAQPLDQVMTQIDKIELGDYSNSKPLQTDDELGMISRNINDLAQNLKQREKQLNTSRKKLEHLSSHDTLTHLPNRRLFISRVDEAIKRAQRHNKKAAVIFIDLDNFKQVNDSLGHDIGDELLISIAKRLSHQLRDTDTVARIGGDEFNLLIEDIQNYEDVEAICMKLMDEFHTPFECNDHQIHTTISMGIALFPEDGKDSTTLIKNADLAMYQAKDSGRNQFRFYSQELSSFIEKRLEMISALKSAIASGDEFSLQYQPKINSKTERICAIEALVRWNSRSLGFVMPGDFISLAEDTHLIIEIGKWILKQACQDFIKLQKHSPLLETISINVSSVQLNYSDMVQTLQNTIQETQIDPHHIELEITESYIATNEIHAIETLEKFRAMGVKLAIDDFGTGYSSMSYLQKLPVTRLKIDKSFIDNLPDSHESVAIAKAIIILAKTFDLFITAEGVETKEQVIFLQEQECDEIQGYYYSKPLVFEDLCAFIKETTE
ncbi:MAG: EAL domain-containing protein [Helicobacteraceae bacterium]|nr:EAL domain-containing protein [Helicobacteraceae bacterium]